MSKQLTAGDYVKKLTLERKTSENSKLKARLRQANEKIAELQEENSQLKSNAGWARDESNSLREQLSSARGEYI